MKCRNNGGFELDRNYRLIIAVVVIAVIIVAGVAYVLMSGTVTPTVKKIGLITGTGGLGDKSFNDIAYAGALLAKDDFGIHLERNRFGTSCLLRRICAGKLHR